MEPKILVVTADPSFKVTLGSLNTGLHVNCQPNPIWAMEAIEPDMSALIIDIDGYTMELLKSLVAAFRAENPASEILATRKAGGTIRLSKLDIPSITKPINPYVLHLFLRQAGVYNVLPPLDPGIPFTPEDIFMRNLGKRPHALSPRPAVLLAYLMERKTRVVSREELIRNPLGLTDQVKGKMQLRTYIHEVNSRLRAANSPGRVVNERYTGYQWVTTD